jgi:hypothetical protein
MDIGMILIQVQNGMAQVVRCEEDGAGTRLVPASNTPEIAGEIARVLGIRGITLAMEGLYLCTDQLQAAAEFSPLPLPTDTITMREAGMLLAPHTSQQERWERISALREAATIRIYRVGTGPEVKQYVSRAAVAQFAAQQVG